MKRTSLAALAVTLVLPGCTAGSSDKAGTPSRSLTRSAASPVATATTTDTAPPAAGASIVATPAPSPAPSATASAPQSVRASPTAALPTYGAGPAWPRAPRSEAPPAYGAVITKRQARTTSAGMLAAGLLLPRLDRNAATPLVMTPCGRQVRLRAADVQWVAPGSGGRLPKRAREVVVLIDPGHGGAQAGAPGVDGSREADRVLELARQVAAQAARRVGRVYLTRNRDLDASLPFRTAIGDAIRADVAVSVHLNAVADGPLDRPGVETYGPVSDPQGRRLAGVMYEAQRRYLERFPGPWVGYRDAGAKYRLGRGGSDYYGLLRRAHVPWVISESLFMTNAHDIALLDRPEFTRGLAAAITEGAVAFTTTRAPGSGWVEPEVRTGVGAPQAAAAPACVDPAR